MPPACRGQAQQIFAAGITHVLVHLCMCCFSYRELWLHPALRLRLVRTTQTRFVLMRTLERCEARAVRQHGQVVRADVDVDTEDDRMLRLSSVSLDMD